MSERRALARELLLLACFCGYFFFFGLGSFGLIGADEPRYAQVAREMLARHDCITPTLGGRPWLEKPVLYYWQAMISYKIFGVHDWAARVPSAFDAMLMIFAVYFFLRRFRPGIELDGALMTASMAAVIGFSRAASTDMPLAAMFTIGMLGWYAWMESGAKSYLTGFYVFIALGMLAKGPVAPFLAALIIIVFAVLLREVRIIGRTLWAPGILLFCAVALPWYVAVQIRNPSFLNVFILQHNLERFGTNLYHHVQPFWYYIPVALLGLAPWTVFAVSSGVDAVRRWCSRKENRPSLPDLLGPFLLIWLILPILFFSVSQSKLPGYILPALPAGALLLANYMRRQIEEQARPNWVLAVLHSLVAVVPVVPAFMIAHIVLLHKLPWDKAIIFPFLLAILLAIGIAAVLNSRLGFHALRFATLLPVVIAVAAVLRIGAPVLNAKLSARPLAYEILASTNHALPVAVMNVSRETEYGLHFYLNQTILKYAENGIPAQEHILIAPAQNEDLLRQEAPGRQVLLLGQFAPQHLDYYWVSARQ
jgi:4-amino-4-deoxy-L-arabinose transferase-like glycosyltransferase